MRAMVRTYTSLETENRAAFVVQLNSLIGSLAAVISSNTLNAATKAKLDDVQSAVDEWREAIGPLEVSKPYALPAGNAATPTSPTQASAGPAEADATTATPEGPATSASAAQSDEATAIGRKTVVDLVGFIALLYTSGLPESPKLRAMAKGVARLLIVRCNTILYAALQHVSRLTYHTNKSPEETLDVFVLLSRDIRRATSAMVRCLDLICSFAEFTDVSSVRFAQQVCVDALRNVRHATLHFQARVEREEAALLAKELGGGSGGAGTSPPATPVTGSAAELAEDSRDTEHQREGVDISTASPPPEALQAHCAQRVAWLRQTWGPSLTRSVVQVGHIMGPAVRFLVAVAGVKEVSGPAGIAALKQDAQADLFALSGTATPSPKEAVLPDPPAAGAAKAGADADRAQDAEVESAAETPSPRGNTSPSKPADHAHASIAAAAALVLPLVGIDFSAECLAVMSENSGDESDGKLVATRIVTDTLRHLSEAQPALLHIIVQGQPWKQRLFTGILNGLVSVHPAVLEAGLSDLHVIVTRCPGALGAEVGYLYNNCLLKLLESENSPTHTKKEIIIHLVMTLLKSSPTVPAVAEAAEGAVASPTTSDVPLLLHLYRLYDLNEGAHQLNVIQQFVAALSRIVRSAALSEFAPIGTTESATEESGAVVEAPRVSLELQAARHATLPSLAMRGLVLLVEVLSTQTPPEDDAWTVDVASQLAPLTSRERKQEGQRNIDIFVASPKKGIQKIFGVTTEEFSPAGHDDFAAEWDHTKCPVPASEGIRQKVQAVTDFLMSVTSTCPDEVAEFLTTPAVFSLQVCVEYMSRLPFAGCGLVDAIQVLLAHVELPKEGQRIERLLEYFGAAYFAANNVVGVDRAVFPFERDDTCFVVIVAMVMLNTDLHNPLSGSRMNQKSFRAQLKACDRTITDAFADDIFFSISRRPLNSAKSLSAASVAGRGAVGGPAGNGGGGAAGGGPAQDSYYRFDALFISAEERRKLAFGMEQQRLVGETMARWQCAIPSLAGTPLDQRAWCAVARDLFTCTWPSVCAVFGPAMYQQNAAVVVPDALLLECIRGLKSLMCVAAAFALPTEGEVTLLALLGLCDHTSVRAACRVAMLQVASTGYAVHLTPRCWMHIFQLLVSMRTEMPLSAMPPQVEGLLALLERITSTSCEEESRRTATQSNDAGQKAAHHGETIATTAIHRVLEGALDVLKTCAKGDARALAAGLYFLRRVLQFSRITHTRRGSEVVTFVDIRDLAQIVVPRLVSLVTRQSGSEEALQHIFGTVVDLLATIWASDVPDAALDNTVECYNALRACFEKHTKSPLVQSHVLQAIQELMSRTLRHPPGGGCSADPFTHHAVTLMLEIWRRVLCPVAETVSRRDAANAETSSLAVLVLRKTVVLTCGSQRTLQIPVACQSVALVLLTDVAFVGALCGNTETSQACLAQLTTLCGGCLTREAASPPTPAQSSPAMTPPRSPLSGRAYASTAQPGQRPHHPTDVPSQSVVHLVARMLIGKSDDTHHPTSVNARLVSYGMERLCLLTRAVSEQTRGEAITNLRTLCLQLKPAHITPLATRICRLVTEGLHTTTTPMAVGESTAGTGASVLSPSAAQSFWILFTNVPSSLKPCSSAVFNATLPALLHLLVHDLLGMAEATQLGDVSQLVVESCLRPMCTAPVGAVSTTTRGVAIKALMQCATLCVTRYQASTAAVPTMAGPAVPQGVSHDITVYFPVAAFLNTVSHTLLRLRVPVERVVPADADVPGEGHWARVVEQCADAVLSFERAVREAEDTPNGDAEAPNDAHATGSHRHNGGSSAVAARAATAQLSLFRFSGGVGDEGPVADDVLVQSCAFVAQLLSGLPNVLRVILPAGAAVHPWTESPVNGSGPVPQASPEVLLALLLDTARGLFAMQWRVCHGTEMAEFYQRYVDKGREAQAVPCSTALLPHTAVRGVLNSYLELALFTPTQNSDAFLAVLLGILEGLGAAQQVATNTGSVSQGRLNAQAQQHIRTCSAGMYQELSIVLACWIKTLTTETSLVATPESGTVATVRTQAFEDAALDARLFLALASLLSPTAGPLIVTVRDFFAWYISKNGLRPPTAASNGSSAQLHSSLRDAAPMVAEGKAASEAAPPSDKGVHSSARSSLVLGAEDEL